jgi:colicin import membrane protein
MDWGLLASGATHALLLLATLVVFSEAKTFEEAQEAVPVEVVTDAQLHEVTRGDQTAPPTPKPPERRVEETAPRPAPPPVPTPTPVERESVPPTPPQVERFAPEPEPRPAPAPLPVPRAVEAPTPPVRPAPPAPTPSPAPRPEAEARPEPKPAPTPPVRPRLDPPRQEARQEPVRQEPARQEPARQEPARQEPRVDQLARLIEAKRREEEAQRRAQLAMAAPAAPAAARESARGAPTGGAQRMSPSMWGQLDGLLQERYRGCWNKFGFDGAAYIPQIRVTYSADGALASDPVLVNPPTDPAERALADSAMRAVRKCDPLKLPPEFAQYHSQWKARTLRFDPEEM